MNLDEMKKLYSSGNWVCYVREKRGFTLGNWEKANEPKWNVLLGYKLIHKDHESIMDTVIANPDVEVEYTHKIIGSDKLGGIKVEDFFTHYEEHFDYRLKPVDEPFKVTEVDEPIEVHAVFTEDKDTFSMSLKMNKVTDVMLRQLIVQSMIQIIKQEEANAFSLMTELMGKVAEDM
jgi:hypothetical protein